MRIHPAVALSFILLVMMGGAGVASGFWGYALGREALKSVTQPDLSPVQRLSESGAAAGGADGEQLAMLLDEEDILQKVNDIINGKVPAETESPIQTDAEAAEEAATPKASPAGATQLERTNAALPIQSRDGDVTLVVTQASKQNDSLVLAVNLKNEGEEAVRFLYSFLSVTDSEGRALSAITDGLPGELPPNGQAFEGTIEIPLALLEGSKTLSLSLTDYPDQRLKINLTGIPVAQ